MRLHFPHPCLKTMLDLVPWYFYLMLTLKNCLFQPPSCFNRFWVNPSAKTCLSFMEFRILPWCWHQVLNIPDSFGYASFCGSSDHLFTNEMLVVWIPCLPAQLWSMCGTLTSETYTWHLKKCNTVLPLYVILSGPLRAFLMPGTSHRAVPYWRHT